MQFIYSGTFQSKATTDSVYHDVSILHQFSREITVDGDYHVWQDVPLGKFLGS